MKNAITNTINNGNNHMNIFNSTTAIKIAIIIFVATTSRIDTLFFMSNSPCDLFNIIYKV